MTHRKSISDGGDALPFIKEHGLEVLLANTLAEERKTWVDPEREEYRTCLFELGRSGTNMHHSDFYDACRLMTGDLKDACGKHFILYSVDGEIVFGNWPEELQPCYLAVAAGHEEFLEVHYK